jgi:hypothetical protein
MFIRQSSRNLCLAVLNVVQGKATFPGPPIAIMRADSRFDSKFAYSGPPFDVRNNEKSRLLSAFPAGDVLAANSMCAHM